MVTFRGGGGGCSDSEGFICEWSEIYYGEGHTGSPEWGIAVSSTVVVRVRLVLQGTKS